MSGQTDAMREAVADALDAAWQAQPDREEVEFPALHITDAAIKAVYAELGRLGWAVVPKASMTEEMSEACGWMMTSDEWADMLAAAPKPPGSE